MHTYISTYLPTYLPTDIHTYIHTYIYTYIHTYIHIKAAQDKLTGPLHGVFNFLFNKGEWPEIWAEGLINPVHKKGSQNIEDNSIER